MPIQDLQMLGSLQNIFQPTSYLTNNSNTFNAQPPPPSISTKSQELPIAVQQQQAQPVAAKSTPPIGPNIEEMSLNELKEECRRRKLLVTGNKQKLIDRIRTSMTSQLLNGVKSPDSGVNMDSSPNFISSKNLVCSSRKN